MGVKDGTYTRGSASSHCSSSTTHVVCLWRGGTSSAHVRFFAEHRWGASVDGQHSTDNGWTWAAGANYIDVDGFDVHGLVSDGGSASGFELYTGGQGSTVSNCHAHDIGRQNTNTTNGLVGVFISQNNVTVSGCYMHDIGRTNYGQGDHGVYLNQGNNVVITGNYFDTFNTGWGVQFYPSAETGTVISNNTFIGGKPDYRLHARHPRRGPDDGRVHQQHLLERERVSDDVRLSGSFHRCHVQQQHLDRLEMVRLLRLHHRRCVAIRVHRQEEHPQLAHPEASTAKVTTATAARDRPTQRLLRR